VGVAPLDRHHAGLRGGRRSVEVRLADAQVDDVLAGGLASLRLGADSDRLGSLEVGEILRERIGQADDFRLGGKIIA
jgi:hypothetical protein